jgi:hypothetical protein
MHSNRRFFGNISTQSIPVDTRPVSNRHFPEKLARLETPSISYKTNADHDF